MRNPASAELVIQVSPLKLGYSCFLSFHLLLHEPNIWRGSVFEYMSEFAASLYYLLLLATKKPGETSDSGDSTFLTATSGMGEAYPLLRLCPRLQSIHTILLVGTFSYNFVFCSQFCVFPQRIWTCLHCQWNHLFYQSLGLAVTATVILGSPFTINA